MSQQNNGYVKRMVLFIDHPPIFYNVSSNLCYTLIAKSIIKERNLL